MIHSQHPLDNKLLLGRYRVMRLLGEGGMGTVHLARVEGAEGFTRPVVVKRMKRDIRASDEGNRLFIREAKILSKLQHPGIVGIVDFGVEDGAHIMVLDYVHGYTLSPWLEFRQRCNAPLPVDICLFIVRRVLDALHYAHHFGGDAGQEFEIVHRDVSPDNILLSNKGYVHLLDFGIASMRGPQGEGATKSGAFRGKLCYAAPETVKGQPATPRSDQYSAAVVLLELLTGKTPFEADSIAETFLRMVNDEPPSASSVREDVPQGLDAALSRALAKEPAQRFDSALAFSRELRRFQSDDDEVAQRLRQLVRDEFERLPAEVGVESLKARESALEKILSIVPKQGPEPSSGGRPQHELPTMMDVNLSRSLGRLDTPAAALSAPLPPAPAQKQLQGLLWGLIGVGGLIAIGLGAAVAVMSRSNSSHEPVVVVGGSAAGLVASPQLEPGALPAQSALAQAEQAAPETPLSAATAQGVEGLAPGAPARGGARLPVSSNETAAERERQLSRAVQQQSAAYQACFSQHLSAADSAPVATLHFEVAAAGGAAQVKVEPPAVASSPLGTCLKGAASQVRFAAAQEPVSFRVPVRARVTRGKAQP